MSTPIHPSYRWSGEDLDLDAYLARIGFDGERTPTLATLRRLVHRHTTTFPFENLEIVLGQPVLLDVESMQDRMVRRRRGGYCFENCALFAAALERLGFGITGPAGRIFMGQDSRLLPATHALLQVTTADDARAWLCDVGFGSGPLEPIELTAQNSSGSPGPQTIVQWIPTEPAPANGPSPGRVRGPDLIKAGHDSADRPRFRDSRSMCR